MLKWNDFTNIQDIADFMMTLSQILAIVIFVLMFAAIASGKISRHIAVLVGAASMILVVFLGTMHDPEPVLHVVDDNVCKLFGQKIISRRRFGIDGPGNPSG